MKRQNFFHFTISPYLSLIIIIKSQNFFHFFGSIFFVRLPLSTDNGDLFHLTYTLRVSYANQTCMTHTYSCNNSNLARDNRYEVKLNLIGLCHLILLFLIQTQYVCHIFLLKFFLLRLIFFSTLCLLFLVFFPFDL